MAGGFLSGLGAGLQGVARTVGQYDQDRREQENKDRAFNEGVRQFDLEQSLANNQLGELVRSHKAGETLGENELAQRMKIADMQHSIQKNDLGLRYMQMDYGKQNDELNRQVDRERIGMMRPYYGALAEQAGDKYQNHYYDAVGIGNMVNNINNNITRMLAANKMTINDLVLGNDSNRNRVVAQIEKMRRAADLLTKEMGRRYDFDPNTMDALNYALSAEDPATPGSNPGQLGLGLELPTDPSAPPVTTPNSARPRLGGPVK